LLIGANEATGSTARGPIVLGSNVISDPVINNVYPSGDALATTSLPMLPDAPGWFSTPLLPWSAHWPAPTGRLGHAS